MRRIATHLVVMLVAVHAGARADDEARPEATPYRPTVTTPAALSAPHWLEGEFGGLVAHDRSSDEPPSNRSSVPYTLKYAFSEDWGVRVGGEALVRAHAESDDGRDGRIETGFGDTSIVGKRRFAVDDAQAFGLEVGVLFPTARRALAAGSGKPDWSLNGIYSVDVAGWHSDANLIETRMGGRDEGTSRWQTTAALAASHPLVPKWQIAGELAGTREPGRASTAQFLAALAYSPRDDVVFDFGGVRGLNRATPSWQAFAGITVVIGRID